MSHVGRPKGYPKTGGRQKGTPNKKISFSSRIARTAAVLEAYGKNPIEEILKLIPKLDPVEQVRAWQYMHQYVDMKPKAIEESDPDAPHEPDAMAGVSTEELIERAKREAQ